MSDLITLPRATVQQALEALEGGGDSWRLIGPAIDALKTALAEEALQRLTDVHQEIEAVLAQPEQEPVAWMRPDNRVAEESTARTQFSRGAVKPPIGTWVPLYTHPPRREWRGLTEEEVDQMAGNTVDAWECARAIEAALKERNA